MVAVAPDAVTAAAPVPEVVAPVPEVVAPAAEVVAPVADLLATESEFFALVQHLLGSVVGAVVPLTQLQTELASFLFDSTGVEPVTNASGYPDGAALSAAVHAWVASEVPLLRAFASFPGVSVAWIAPAVFCATTQPCGASSLPGLAVQWVLRSAPCEPSPPGLLSRLDAVAAPGGAGLMILNVAGVLPISLAVLAALALPGAGGLTILTAAGVRIGYRQAKAGFVVQTGDIARFARPGAGPVGVVRSGSVVVLPVARPRAVSAGYSFEKAAA
jgi:hypothetical protein